MMTKQRIGVVGLGAIALKAHLPVLTSHPHVEVIALCSRWGRQVQGLVDQYRLTLQANTFASLLDLRPDAVYLLSSTEAHPDQAQQLLQAGIAVFMEKPLALDLTGAHRIRQTVENSQGLLMVGFNRRFAPAYRRAMELFSDQPPEFVQIQKHRSGQSDGWSLRQTIMDDTIHIIDLARYLCQSNSQLSLQASIARPSLIAAQLRSQEATLVQLSQSHGAGMPTERVELHGHGLSVIVESMERLYIRQAGTERVETMGGSWTSTLEKRGILGETEHFLDCVRNNIPPITNVHDAILTQELAEEILQRGDQ